MVYLEEGDGIYLSFFLFPHSTTIHSTMKEKQVPVTSKSESREAERSSALGVDDEKKQSSDHHQFSGESGNVQTLQKKKSFFGSVNLKKKVKR